MMGSGRTHHHVTKQKSEDQSRRSTFAMDYLMKVSSVVNAQKTSEESVKCSAVKEDKHQNITSKCCVEQGSRRTVDT